MGNLGTKPVQESSSTLARLALIFFALVGVTAIVVAIAADIIGIGGQPGFGERQIALGLLGLTILIGAIALLGLTIPIGAIVRDSTNVTKKQAIFTVLRVLLVIVFLEVVLNLFALMSPRVDMLLSSVALTVPDERLGHRPNPAFPGNDSKGFRNPKVPAKADVVVLGDSQTYGSGVEPEQAWPRQLEPMIAQTVYSMAYGGYGPVHSLILWEEAIALEPKIIIEAFYAGNDLFDAFSIVYNHGQFVELKSTGPQLQESVREAEESEPIAERVSRMFNLGAPAPRTAFSPRAFLAQRSKIYGLLLRTRYIFASMLTVSNDPWEKAKAFAEANSAYTQVFNNGQFRTVFTSEYRFAALDLKDPRIAEGHEIALRAIQKMNERAADRNIQFVVVLIPTKELVFQELWRSPSPTYRNLTEDEVVLWKITKDSLERNGIEYVDALPALREQLAFGVQPYKVSHDGHPNEHGHKAVANLIAAYLIEPH